MKKFAILLLGIFLVFILATPVVAKNFVPKIDIYYSQEEFERNRKDMYPNNDEEKLPTAGSERISPSKTRGYSRGRRKAIFEK